MDDDVSVGSSPSNAANVPSSAAQQAALALAILGPNHRGNVTFEAIEEAEDQAQTQGAEENTGVVSLNSTMNSAAFAETAKSGELSGLIRSAAAFIKAKPGYWCIVLKTLMSMHLCHPCQMCLSCTKRKTKMAVQSSKSAMQCMQSQFNLKNICLQGTFTAHNQAVLACPEWFMCIAIAANITTGQESSTACEFQSSC